MRLPFFILLPLLVLVVFSRPGICLSAAASPEYKLQPGDEIHLRILGEDSLSGTYALSTDGMAALPLIGEVKLAGLTEAQADALIKTRLEDGYLVDPQISVIVARYQPVYVLGEVRNPGKYDYMPGMTVLNAAALAGGFTYRADRETARVHKKRAGGPESYSDLSMESAIRPGDVLIIQERFF